MRRAGESVNRMTYTYAPPPPPPNGERPMGAAAYGGKGFRERARVSGERPMGAGSCRQQSTAGVMPTPPPPHPWEGGLACRVLVCSRRRLLADRHSLPFPRTLSLHRRWCPSASHPPPVPFLSLPCPILPSPLFLSFPRTMTTCHTPPMGYRVSCLWLVRLRSKGGPLRGPRSTRGDGDNPDAVCLGRSHPLPTLSQPSPNPLPPSPTLSQPSPNPLPTLSHPLPTLSQPSANPLPPSPNPLPTLSQPSANPLPPSPNPLPPYGCGQRGGGGLGIGCSTPPHWGYGFCEVRRTALVRGRRERPWEEGLDVERRGRGDGAAKGSTAVSGAASGNAEDVPRGRRSLKSVNADPHIEAGAHTLEDGTS